MKYLSIEKLIEQYPNTFGTILNTISDGVAILSRINNDYVYIYLNKQAKHYFQINKVINKTLKEVHDSKTASFLRSLLINIENTKESQELKISSEDALDFIGEFTVYPLSTQTNIFILMIKNIQFVEKVMELEEKDRELKESEERYKAIVEMSPDAVFVHNEQNKIIYLNQAALKLLGGSTQEQIMDKSIYQFIHDDSSGIIKERLRLIIQTGQKSGPVERKFRKINGSSFYVELHAGRVSFNGKYAVQTICRDITERKNQEQQLKQMVYQDQLTKVYNRRYLYHCLANEIKAIKEDSSKKLALFFLDLDKFKEINDSLGHQVGDEVLEIFAKRVKTMLRERDIIARLGGDEFIILMPEITPNIDLLNIANQISEHIEKPIVLDNHTIEIKVSVGISLCPDHGMIEEELIHSADKALYQAKDVEGRRIHFYEPDQN